MAPVLQICEHSLTKSRGRSCSIDVMSTQPDIPNSRNLPTVIARTTSVVLPTDDPTNLTLDELRELPHAFSLGFDLDAEPTTERSPQ